MSWKVQCPLQNCLLERLHNPSVPTSYWSKTPPRAVTPESPGSRAFGPSRRRARGRRPVPEVSCCEFWISLPYLTCTEPSTLATVEVRGPPRRFVPETKREDCTIYPSYCSNSLMGECLLYILEVASFWIWKLVQTWKLTKESQFYIMVSDIS